MGSLWYLIPLLLALLFARAVLKPASPRAKAASEPERTAPERPSLRERWLGLLVFASDFSFSAFLLFSVMTTFMLVGARGENLEAAIALAAIAYCGAVYTYRAWQPPKIVPGGWRGNVRHELRCLTWAYAIVLAPLVAIGTVKLALHGDGVDLAYVGRFVAGALVALGVAWLIRYFPLPDEKLTVDED